MGKMRDRVKKRAEMNKNKGAAGKFKLPDGTNILKPKAKTYSLDIIPYRVTVDNHPEVKKGELWFERTIFVHYGVGSEDKSKLCRRTIKQPCPVCEERKALMQEGGEDTEELVESLKPKERVLYNVIDLDDQDKGIQLLDISYFCMGKQLDEEIREGEDSFADFAELKGGKTLKIRFSEESAGKNKYAKASRIDFKDRKDYKEDILDQTIDLDKILVILEYDELEKVLHDVADDGDADEKKEEKPTGRTRSQDRDETPEPEEKKKTTKAKEPEEDDDVAKERARRRAERDKKDEGPKCPHGHKFGVDTDEFKDDCDNCKVWVECDDAKSGS